MEDIEGVIEIGDTGVIEIEAIAVAVQAPVPDKTVYVVVAVGETTTVAAAGITAPELAVQTKGPAPVAVKV